MSALMNRGLPWLLAALTVFIFIAVSVADADAGKYKRKSKEHEDACKAWCADNGLICDHCGKKINCGKDYETVKSWTGYGKNWYACKKRQTRLQRSNQNKYDCQQYCERNPDCAKCDRKCGAGFKIMRKWTGRGENWKACTYKKSSRTSSNLNRNACINWCEHNQELCTGCSPNKRCGKGKVAVRSWKGRGRNWHACADRGAVKARNREDCNRYCFEHRETCMECKTNKGCGGGQSAMQSFRLGNSPQLDYHACRSNRAAGELRLGD